MTQEKENTYQPLRPAELKALVRKKGWTFVDVAARWGVSVTWMSRLVNEPQTRTAAYEDAFRGLPPRNEVPHVIREARHRRVQARKKPAKKPEPRKWTADEMFPVGRVFVSLDNKVIEEGTQLICQGVQHKEESIFVKYLVKDGESAGEEFELRMDVSFAHLGDLGLDDSPS